MSEDKTKVNKLNESLINPSLVNKSHVNKNVKQGKVDKSNASKGEKELRILAAMRKTLSSVVRDVTPSSSSLKSPLSESTTEDIIMCFGLITAREQELAKLQKNKQSTQQKPHYIDERKSTQTVSLDSLKSTLNKTNNIKHKE